MDHIEERREGNIHQVIDELLTSIVPSEAVQVQEALRRLDAKLHNNPETDDADKTHWDDLRAIFSRIKKNYESLSATPPTWVIQANQLVHYIPTKETT